MKPLFEVSEECLVMSVTTGKLEETSVLEVVKADIITYPDGSERITGNGFAYSIDLSYRGISGATFVAQYQLRKKHKPSDFDFNELMKEINDLVVVKG